MQKPKKARKRSLRAFSPHSQGLRARRARVLVNLSYIPRIAKCAHKNVPRNAYPKFSLPTWEFLFKFKASNAASLNTPSTFYVVNLFYAVFNFICTWANLWVNWYKSLREVNFFEWNLAPVGTPMSAVGIFFKSYSIPEVQTVVLCAFTEFSKEESNLQTSVKLTWKVFVIKQGEHSETADCFSCAGTTSFWLLIYRYIISPKFIPTFG